MTNPLTALYVRGQMLVANRVEQARNDKGAGLVEYGALIVLALAILGAIYSSEIITKVDEGIGEALDKLFTPSAPETG